MHVDEGMNACWRQDKSLGYEYDQISMAASITVRSWVRIPSSISPQSSGGNDYQLYGVTGTPSPSPGARVAVRVRVAARIEEGRGEKRKGRVTVQRG
jgi:hypothetical protein